ncbi:unnamed protein product, partial [Gulo gulo]
MGPGAAQPASASGAILGGDLASLCKRHEGLFGLRSMSLWSEDKKMDISLLSWCVPGGGLCKPCQENAGEASRSYSKQKPKG